MTRLRTLVVALVTLAGACGGDEAVPDGPGQIDADPPIDNGGSPLDAHAGIILNLAGPGAGVVEVVDPGGTTTSCAEPVCLFAAPAGGSFELHAVAASTFGGWSGACTAATGPCTIDLAGNASASVTATFAAEPDEVAAYLVPAASGYHVTAVGFRPDGGVIVTDGAAIASRAPDGTIEWTTPLPATGIVQGFDTDGAGRAFALVGAGGNTLHAVTAAGAVAWSPAIAGAAVSDLAFGDMVDATEDGGAVVAWNGGGGSLRRYDAAGGAAWTVTGQPFAYGVAVAPGGPIHLAAESAGNPDFCETVDVSLAGAVLASSYTIPGYYDVVLAADAGGAIVASSAGHGNVRVSRQGGFDINEAGLGAGALDHGVAVDSTGAVVDARAVLEDSIGGVVFHRRDPAGALLASFTHAPQLTPLATVGVRIQWIAAGPDGRVALAGQLVTSSATYDLVQVFDFAP